MMCALSWCKIVFKVYRFFFTQDLMIPLIIHQTWKTREIPSPFAGFVDSWKANHPEYTHMLWTDDDNDKFVHQEYPEYASTYDDIPSPVMKCDFMRYLWLYHYGGYYVDLDVMCHKRIDCLPLEPEHDVVLTEEHPEHGLEFSMSQIITNWFMGCDAKAPFMKLVIDTVLERLRQNPGVTKPLSITGPFMMTQVYDQWKRTNTRNPFVLDYQYLNPFPKRYIWSHDQLPALPDKTIGVHYYVGTWWKPTTQQTSQPRSPPGDEAVFTIVTPTVGRRTLLRLKECLRKERVPYVHLIMWDTKRCENALRPCDLEDERTFCYEMKHPLQIPPEDAKTSRVDVWLRALGISMARTPYIKCCDDDTWPEENHLEKVLHYMEANQLDFTWCYRRMWKRSGEVIGIDKFEATGEPNAFGYTLLDNSSLFYNKKAGSVLHQVFLQKQVYGDDRYTSEPLHKYCKGKRMDAVLTNHECQPHLERFFVKNCSPN